MNLISRICQPKVQRLSLAFALATPLTASAQLPLQQDDVVCLIGNGLADRMQHDGWVETLIQSQMAGKNLSFRNLAVAGDTVTSRPRSKGVPSPEDYLAQCKADAIFVFFGYNESYGGEAKLAQFKNDLTGMVDKYRSAKFNDESPPRLILFSPIAHENLGDPLLPDGKANNTNLALYTNAIKQVAAEKGTAFVDLFTCSQALYAKAKAPLTLNGVHPLPEGNRQLGEVIAAAVTGKSLASSPAMEPLRQAVLDKDWHWHNRYRATDENDIWGSRAGLRFVAGQTNQVVLVHELSMLDVMTANRDAKIHAVAQGRDLKVDDSKVPKSLEVVSNVGGGSKSSSAMKEGNTSYLSGKESLAKINVPEGFAVNLFADEAMFPALANPVQMQVDTKGRLWAACWSTYPKWEPLKEMTDSLLLLPDENRDGVADKAIEFARVHNPLGFAFWGGGVIVASQPDILFLKDTDGDDKADLFVIFTRFLNLPDDEMAHVEAYLERGGPIVGLRTASHAFKIPANSKYAKYDFESKVAGYENGFGQQILGNTWVGHYGTNHKQGTRIQTLPDQRGNVILTGVAETSFCHAGAYVGKPGPDFTVLTNSQPLVSMDPTAAPDTTKPPMPSTWTRQYAAKDGSKHRVFHSTQGASEDILDDNYRRLLINGILWAAGMEKAIKPDLSISFVGPYQPNTFAFGGHAKKVKPSDLDGWDTPIMPARAKDAPAE
jgi:type 1 glutamine amidotransferase/lysophospholipase L1-like esterase